MRGGGVPATEEGARRALRDWLAKQGMVFPELVVENGSGLSRTARISAASLARVLVFAAAGPYAQALRESLPIAGVDGTMKYRLAGQPIAGNAWIKTGSLDEVRTIAGYVDAASGGGTRSCSSATGSAPSRARPCRTRSCGGCMPVAERGVHRTRTAALASMVYGAGLAYLSLARGGDWSCTGALLAEQARLATVSRADVVVNVVAYIPFGVMLAASLRSRIGRVGAVLAATLIGAALSLSVEIGQSCLPARTSSWIDLVANAAGAMLGAGLYMLEFRPAALNGRGTGRSLLAAEPLRSLALLTLLAWFAHRTFPWVLGLDVGQLRQNLVFLKPLLAGEPALDPWRFTGNFAQWVLAGTALRAMLQPWAPVLRTTVALAVFAIVTQLLLAVPTLSLEQLASFVAALAVLVVLRLPGSVRAYPAAMALAALVMATSYQLRPGQGATSAAFSWWPVFGVGGSPLGALQLGIFFFSFAFACALALAWAASGPGTGRARVPRARATADHRQGNGPRSGAATRPAVLPTASFASTLIAAMLSIGWLAALEVAQLWIPGRTADTSTPLLAMTGWAIALAVQSRATDPDPPRSRRSAH